MKSFCVLNSIISRAAAENIGSAAAAVLGRKAAVLSDGTQESAQTAVCVAQGVKKAGGCALVFENAFEAQLGFVFEHYDADCALFVCASGKKCSISISVNNGGTVTAQQEEKMAELALNGVSERDDGSVIFSSLENVYYKRLIEFAVSFENTGARIECGNPFIKTVLARALPALGGERCSRPVFFISRSGLCMSARDENGNIHTHEKLMAVFAFFLAEKGDEIELPFSLRALLPAIAAGRDSVHFSFSGGNELWQRDCVTLAAGLMSLMSRQGCGLAQLCSCLPEGVINRRCFTSRLSAPDIADRMDCDEVLTDGNNVFAVKGEGKLLVTPAAANGKYCLEIFACDAETASELSDLLDIPC